MYSEKPKTQRLPKKKQQEEAIKQAKLKQLTKPQPAPEKPKTVAKTTAPMKKRMKPIRGPMVETKQKSKPMAGNRRTDISAQPTAGRMTAADMFEKRKKEKRKELTRQMKPLRIG
jgi:hypothetical protein